MKFKSTLFALLMSLSAFSQSLDWQITDVAFSTGDTVKAEFRTYNFTGIGAFQFAMKYDTGALIYANPDDPFQFTSNLPGLDSDAFSWYGLPGYNLQPGEIRSVWTNPYGTTIEDGTHIFSVVFVAKSDGSLSQYFPVWYNHPVLKPIAYTATPLQYLPFHIAYVSPAEQETTATIAPDEAGLNVYPNPSAGRFFVDIPRGVTSLRLYSGDSRLLWEISSGIPQGGTMFIENDGLPGLYFLEASSGKEVLFVKQVIKN